MQRPYNGGMGNDPKKVAGNLIRRERMARGWSRKRLSEEMGRIVGPSAIGNYEYGLRLFSPAIARAFDKVLGIAAAKLLGVGGAKMDLSDQEILLIEAFRKLPLDDRAAYLKRIQGVAELYGDPVPDEQLPAVFRRKPGKSAKPKKGVKSR